MLSQKIIEDTERARRKNDAQPLDDPLQRPAEGGRAGHRAQHHEDRGGKRKEHVERNSLRQRDAAGEDAEHGAVEPLQEY